MKVLIDPKLIGDLDKKQLVELYAMTCSEADEFDAQKKAIRDLLLDKVSGDGEIIGKYSVTKAKRIGFKVELPKARELGAVKETVDNAILKNLMGKGVKIPHEITEYVVIREVRK
tara:strand:- start:485 stop:829 length:345 start_codon:yes stop_codon:yes gene_type:complete